MSGPKFAAHSFGKNLQNTVKNIKPVLQSKKKAEAKSLESSMVVGKDKKISSPLRKIEAEKKEKDGNIVGYKAQRELLHRNARAAKTERGTLKEIEKIQEKIRKNQNFYEGDEESDRKNKTPNGRVCEERKSFEYLSVKEQICKRLMEKNGFKQEKIEFQQNIRFFDEVKVPVGIFEIAEEQRSFEKTEELMPEIPFFQYNYAEEEEEEQDFYDEPYPNTISVVVEMDLYRRKAKTITTITKVFAGFTLPLMENPIFVSETRVKVNKIMVLEDNDWESRKAVSTILSRNHYDMIPKPIVPLETYESQLEILLCSLEEYEIVSKVITAYLEIEELHPLKTYLNLQTIEIIKHSIEKKPIIGFESYSKKIMKIAKYSILKKPSIDLKSLKKTQEIIKYSMQKKPAIDLEINSKNNLEKNVKNLLPAHESLIKLSIRSYFSYKLLSQLKLQRSRTKRLKESSLYILCNICNTSHLKLSLFKWKSSDLYTSFLNFSAKFIQRNWRGFYTRKFLIPQIHKLRHFIANVKAIIQGWKTRKILATKRIQNHIKNIKDLRTMINELSRDPDSSSKQLLITMIEQLPNMHSKFIKDFNSLYRTGMWVALVKTKTYESKKENVHEDTLESLRYLSNRDDIPIRPLQMTYENILDCSEEAEIKPKRKFTNFLKRKKKNSEEKNTNEVEAVKETESFRENIEFNLEHQEETMQDEKKFEGKPKEFLKRKSRSIKPKKIQWKVQKKIDCWVSKDVYLKKNLKNKEIVEEKYEEKEGMDIEELERIFEEVLGTYVDTAMYLKRFERVNCRTKIPQFKSCSDFLLMHNEENYYDVLEALEGHYLQLCSEGLRL